MASTRCRRPQKACFSCRAEDETLRYGDLAKARSPSLVPGPGGLCGQPLCLTPHFPADFSRRNRRVFEEVVFESALKGMGQSFKTRGVGVLGRKTCVS